MSRDACSRCKKESPRKGFKTCQKCDDYNRAYRAERRLLRNASPTVRKNRKKGVTCGRRHCKQCGHWRPIIDFCVAKWEDPIERDVPQYYRHICRTCERINGRTENAKRAGRTEPYGQEKYVGQTQEERKQRKLKKRREWQKMKLETDPEWAERYREKQRFYAERRRREAGAVPKEIEKSTYQRAKDSELLEIGPFQEWLEVKLNTYESIEEFANLIESSPRAVLRWRSGREMGKNGKERIINKIPLNTVDLAITREGSNGLWELYPELYN